MDMAAESDKRTLTTAIYSLSSPYEVECFLGDLLTPSEFDHLVSRWQVVCGLLEDSTQKDLAKRLGYSEKFVSSVKRDCITSSTGTATRIAVSVKPR